MMEQQAYAFPFYLLIGSKSYKQMIDSRTLGERLRLIRTRLGMTQAQLAAITGQSQPTISRIENGDEVYTSALIAVLTYYHDKISLDNLFAQDFYAEDEHLLYMSRKQQQRTFIQQLDLIADILNEANEVCLTQLTRLKKNIP